MIDTLLVGSVAALVCLMALRLLDRLLDRRLDRMRRQHEAALQRANLIQPLASRRGADPGGPDGDEGAPIRRPWDHSA